MSDGPQVFGVDPFKGSGYKVFESPTKIQWACDIDGTHTVMCTQEITAPLFESNRALLNDSAGRRFGDGRIIGRVDLPTYFKLILPAQKAGDQTWLKKFFNDSNNRKFRTFGGNI